MIDTYGTQVGATGERIVVRFPKRSGKRSKEYPIRRLRKIAVLRPSSVTMHAVKLALEHEVDIVYLGSFGRPVGRIFSSDPKGLATVRRAQLEAANSAKSFELARSFVYGKARNQIAFLRLAAGRYGRDFEKEITQAEAVLDGLSRMAPDEKGKEQLLGVEGYIADRYFTALKRLYRFPGRRPQGRDRVNSALNYGYGILYNEVERACLYAGLDPYLGLYHTERYGKPSLVLDVVEEFRVPVVDAAVFPLFVTRALSKSSNFIRQGKNEHYLSAEGKYKVVKAVFEALNTRVLWKGKRRDVKSVIEEQVYALSRNFLGKEKQYTPFDARKMWQ